MFRLFQITNLVHNSFIFQQYVCYTTLLNMFRAARCSSSGGPTVSPQPLVSSPSVSSRTVCRWRADCPLSTCIVYGCTDGLSPRSSGFSTRPVHVGSVVDEVALGQTFSPITSVFPCQHHSTNPPYSFFSSSTKAIICIITQIIRIMANGATASRNSKEYAVIILEWLKTAKNYGAVFTSKG